MGGDGTSQSGCRLAIPKQLPSRRWGVEYTTGCADHFDEDKWVSDGGSTLQPAVCASCRVYIRPPDSGWLGTRRSACVHRSNLTTRRTDWKRMGRQVICSWCMRPAAHRTLAGRNGEVCSAGWMFFKSTNHEWEAGKDQSSIDLCFSKSRGARVITLQLNDHAFIILRRG